MTGKPLQKILDEGKARLKQFFRGLAKNQGDKVILNGDDVLKLLHAMDASGMLRWLANNAPELCKKGERAAESQATTLH